MGDLTEKRALLHEEGCPLAHLGFVNEDTSQRAETQRPGDGGGGSPRDTGSELGSDSRTDRDKHPPQSPAPPGRFGVSPHLRIGLGRGWRSAEVVPPAPPPGHVLADSSKERVRRASRPLGLRVLGCWGAGGSSGRHTWSGERQLRDGPQRSGASLGHPLPNLPHHLRGHTIGQLVRDQPGHLGHGVSLLHIPGRSLEGEDHVRDVVVISELFDPQGEVIRVEGDTLLVHLVPQSAEVSLGDHVLQGPEDATDTRPEGCLRHRSACPSGPAQDSRDKGGRTLELRDREPPLEGFGRLLFLSAELRAPSSSLGLSHYRLLGKRLPELLSRSGDAHPLAVDDQALNQRLPVLGRAWDLDVPDPCDPERWEHTRSWLHDTGVQRLRRDGGLACPLHRLSNLLPFGCFGGHERLLTLERRERHVGECRLRPFGPRLLGR